MALGKSPFHDTCDPQNERTEHALVELVPGQARVCSAFYERARNASGLHGRDGIPEHGTGKDHSIVANRTLIRDVRLSLTIYYVSPSGHADQPNWIQSLVTFTPSGYWDFNETSPGWVNSLWDFRWLRNICRIVVFESKIFSSNFLERDLEFFNNFFLEGTWFGNEFGIHKWTIFNEGIFERNFQSDFLRL